MAPSPLKPERILVLCVDRDADLTVKANIRGPVIGREENIKAAIKLLLSDPGEADANAIFGAVRTYDEAKSQWPDAEVEVATITGHPRSELLADREIMRELEEVVDYFKADYAILVSDGADDERVLPLLHKFFPSIGVRRIIVQQSRRLEETYFLLRGYLRKLLSEPSARAYVLGVPGSIILMASVLSLFNLQRYLWASLGSFLGLILMSKGFDLMGKIRRIVGYFGRRLGVFSLLIGVLGFAFSLYRAHSIASYLWRRYPIPMILARVVQSTSLLFLAFILIMLTGSALEAYFSGGDYPERIFAIAVSISGWLVLYSFSLYLLGEVGLIIFLLSVFIASIFSMVVFMLSLRLAARARRETMYGVE